MPAVLDEAFECKLDGYYSLECITPQEAQKRMSTLDDIAKAAQATNFALDLLEKIVAFVGVSASRDRIDQFEAARLAADAAEAAKFGVGP